MANGTTDYSLGQLAEAVNNMKEEIRCLTDIQKRQQSIIDKGIGIIIFLGFVGIGNIIGFFASIFN